ncbi:MAG TPA: alpha/beta hydrolase [Tissierellaceae bacterium]|nr:alpha/beta hydrolase [Tissierellaceae bacterium]
MKKRISWLVGAGLLLRGLYRKKTSSSKGKKVTVFVHGYLGNYQSFAPLLSRFEGQYKWGEKVGIYYVFPNNQLKYVPVKTSSSGQDLIQVVFPDNKGSFHDYANWLSLLMRDLKQKDPRASFNLVGHSMGGIACIKYLQDFSNRKSFPRVEKVVTLGSPFAGISDDEYFKQHGLNRATLDLRSGSEAFKSLRQNREKIPYHTDILNIGSLGDQVASPASVQALNQLVHVKNIENYIIQRQGVSHSGLHEDEEVDQLISAFLGLGDL